MTSKAEEDFRDEARRKANEGGHGSNHLPRSILYATPSLPILRDEHRADQDLMRPYQAQTPTKYRKPLSFDHSTESTPRRINASSVSTPTTRQHRPVLAAAKQPAPETTATLHHSVARNAMSTKASGPPRDFQHGADFPSVTVRHVNVTQRSAFDVKELTSLQEWERIASVTKKRRLSPSHKHLQLLHKLQKSHVIRQVQFSPSTGLDADYFCSLQDANEGNADETLLGTRREGNDAVRRRDGRYRSIDPVQATIAVLPETPPILSHKKDRLPNRADVGFPNADASDVQCKQDEIRHETAWEETSPRLVLLVTSDDLGAVAVLAATTVDSGCQGIPYAGRDLLRAKARNAQHWHRPCHIGPNMIGPHPYSMLAPPLESTYSPSQGWRPRPFHDRPAGMHYCLACPMAVSLPDRKNEPLTCSLTLYTLPPLYKNNHQPQPVTATAAAAYHCQKQGTVPAFGKMSEEFWFPAGDWSGQVPLAARVAPTAGGVDAELLPSWLEQRQHKAIFSYDPLDLVMESKKNSSSSNSSHINNRPASLYVVLQIYKSISTNIPPSNNSADMGARLLSPVAFGITKYFSSSKDSMLWPEGQVKEMQLYNCQDKPESQEAFVERLWSVVHLKIMASPTVDDSSLSVVGDELSTLSMDTEDSAKKKGRGSRLFRSSKRERNPPPRLGEHNRSMSVSALATKHQLFTQSTSNLMHGRAKLFLSSLNVDFLQAMLVSPAELNENPPTTSKSEKLLPTILVDISGDSAILLERNQPESIVAESEINGDVVSKRSSLLRLPSPAEPAGYCSSSEFREILYLPARPEKRYDVDWHMGSCNSLVNLLYLYPRLLRISPDAPRDKKFASFTVRIRVLHSDPSDNSEQFASNFHPVNCFHNSAPWTGEVLLDSIYTKIAGDFNQRSHGAVEVGIPIRDEIKVRLPRILDGNYRVEFALYVVTESADSGVALTPVSEASIPLTSLSSQDATSGSRVTTIIPNGKHRLELGVYQLHLETRLVSSIHAGDPAVARALRDLPYGREQRPDLLLGRSISTSSMPDTVAEVSPTLWATSSESTVAGYFQVLLYMHLFSLLQQGHEISSQSLLSSQLQAMQSLFEMLLKVKSKFLASASLDPDPFNMFVKKNLDMFDESCLKEFHQQVKADEVEEETALVPNSLNYGTNQSQEVIFDGFYSEQGRDEIAVRIGSKSVRMRQRDSGTSRIAAAIGPAGSPFFRVAFGASKTDRMRAEAELRHDSSHFAPFFEDDETIATAPSIYSGPRSSIDAKAMLSLEPSLRRSRYESAVVHGFVDDSSITRSISNVLPPADERHSSIGDTEFVKRVRTAASVMLAPCVAPSLSSILKAGRPSPRVADDKAKSSFFATDSDGEPGAFVGAAMCLCASGSDAEDDNPTTIRDKTTERSQRAMSMRVFRGVPDCPHLFLSVNKPGTNNLFACAGKYVYESIMTLWLRSNFENVKGKSKGPSSKTNPWPAAFTELHFDSSGPKHSFTESTDSFFANMNFLLPLCLKSIVLRYSEEVMPKYPPPIKVIADDGHMLVFNPFVEMLTRGLIGQAFVAFGIAQEREKSLRRALSSSQIVLDFLVGLLSVFHPENVRVLFNKYFETLRDAETEQLSDILSPTEHDWTEESIHLARTSRQLRLYAAEKLAVLPSFVALNFPLKYSGSRGSRRSKKANWLNQSMELDPSSFSAFGDPVSEGEKLPKSGWLAQLLIDECLTICAQSCESVNEALAHIELSRGQSWTVSSLRKRPGASLNRDDLLMLQSMAIHAITIAYELVIRRHAMDRRFQSESARGRIAVLLARPILEHSVASARWLSRMDATHKVRSTWLLCFVYVLQEAPEVLICDYVRSCCDPKDVRIHRFIRLLRLCSLTFQSFLDLQRHVPAASDVDKMMSPWLLQESFNTICAASIVVVDACVEVMGSFPEGQKKAMEGILELLLEVLTTPQSPVTHLRAVGGALQALEFDVDLFLDVTGSQFQHWVRIILSLMNSVSLSVRSIAVDFVVSLFGSTFDLHGNIDALSLMFTSVLPEVVAREIAMYSVGGHISTIDDVAKSVWPIRRAIADLEDTSPLDDDRVDAQLAPVLAAFCRACQAVIDGVLVELRLHGESFFVVGTEVIVAPNTTSTFDADEESVLEAASFFVPETAPMQRIRWLLTLKSLHVAKKQWVEAAESLFLCAHTICDAIPHLSHVWRPSRFALWSDHRRSIWLDTVGEHMGRPDRGNTEVMNFAEQFLEPKDFLGTPWQTSATGKLQQPTVSAMCDLLTRAAKEAVGFYVRETGMDELAYSRLESLLKVLMSVVDDHTAQRFGPVSFRSMRVATRMKHAEEEASLRKVSASISGDMTSLAERLLFIVQNEPNVAIAGAFQMHPASNIPSSRRPCYVMIRFYGKKPSRFNESTTIPTFVEWDKPCICRVPKDIVDGSGCDLVTEKVCVEFAKVLTTAVRSECGAANLIFRTDAGATEGRKDGVTYMDVFPVDAIESSVACASILSKHFFHRKGATLVETTVANEFPCALSRQSSLLTTEIVSMKSPVAR